MSTLQSRGNLKKSDCIETFPCTVYIANMLGKYGFNFKLADDFKASNSFLHQHFKDMIIYMQDILITFL